MQPPEKRQILVTGGSGFIGTYLCEKLASLGHRVRNLDLKPSRLDSTGAIETIVGDARDAATLDRCLEGVTDVYHLAAVASVDECLARPLESFDTNLRITALLLDRLRQRKGVRLVFSSTSAVYGIAGDSGQPLREEDVPSSDPLSLYAVQKLASEQLIRLHCSQFGIQAVVFRFFNVFGEGQNPNSPYSGVITRFASSIAEGKPLFLNGGGVTTRDFVHVRDIVEGLAGALTLSSEHCDGKAINLGTGVRVSVKELAERMARTAGKPVTMQDAPARKGDVQHSLADFSRARRLLGWAPRMPLF